MKADRIADGIHTAAQATGIAWLWDHIATQTHRIIDPAIRGLRPVVAPLVAPIDRWERRRLTERGHANLELADQLDRAGLTDSARELRDLAQRQIEKGQR